MRLRTGQSGLANKPLSGSINTVTVASAGVGVEDEVLTFTMESSAATDSSRFGLRATSPRVPGSAFALPLRLEQTQRQLAAMPGCVVRARLSWSLRRPPQTKIAKTTRPPPDCPRRIFIWNRMSVDSSRVNCFGGSRRRRRSRRLA